MKTKPKKTDQEIERAITMLVCCVNQKCRNQKPLILHSIRVGLKLYELSQPQEVIIAGILHDLVEDTDCTIKEINKEFGSRVANLVASVSQEKIRDYKERWRVLMEKIKKVGKPAMILKLIDIYENLNYIPLVIVRNQKELEAIYWKHNFAMEQLKPYLGRLKTFRDCRNGYRKIFKKLKITSDRNASF